MIFSGDKLNSNVYYLPSSLLGREVPLQIFLPQKVAEIDSTFPVLYLLHGLFGRFDNWATFTDIHEYAKECGFAIICAEGGDSWYSDSPHLANHFYEKYISDELIPAAESQINFGKSREKRAIAGLSMGGYGAFKIAFRQPDLFCFAASMSGAFHASEVASGNDWQELQPSIQAVFSDDLLIRKDNDLFRLIEEFPEEEISELPNLYFDCGSEDSFLPINRRLSETLQSRRIAHEFHIFPGGHDWIYWNFQLKNILQKTSQVFS